MKVLCNNLDDTKRLAGAFADNLCNEGCFVSLYGDIGAGKTAFVRYILKHMGVKEKVTSPSFVILNEYMGYKMPIYHFDLYRLENDGLKTVAQELTDYSKRGVLTFVEWADFGKDLLSYDRLNIKITCFDIQEEGDNGEPRYFEFEASGDENKKFVESILKDYGAY